MRIEIDGSPINKPAYAKNLSVGKFAEYVANADEYNPHDSWISGWGGKYMPESPTDLKMFRKVATDPALPEYGVSIIKTGPYNRDTAVLYSAQSIAGRLADELVEQGEYLEMVPTKEFHNPKSPWPIYRDRSDDVKDAFPCLPHLHKGMVVFRGDVDEVTGVWGGTVYVDGDVNEVIHNQSGIIYVRGDVYNLTDTKKAITIVGGKIHNFSQRRNSSGGLGLEVTPSPYIFVSEQIENKKAAEFELGSQRQGGRKLFIEIPPSAYIVSRELLRDWMPEEVKQKAINLCRIRVSAYLEEGLMNRVNKLNTPEDFANFATSVMYGPIEGYTSGYHASPGAIDAY